MKSEIEEVVCEGSLINFELRERVGRVQVQLFTFRRDDMVFRFGRIRTTTDPKVLEVLQRSLDGNGRFLFETNDGQIWSGELMGGRFAGRNVEQFDFSAVTPHTQLTLT